MIAPAFTHNTGKAEIGGSLRLSSLGYSVSSRSVSNLSQKSRRAMPEERHLKLRSDLHTCVCIHESVLCLCVHEFVPVYLCISVHVALCVSVCMNVCVHLCVCVWYVLCVYVCMIV